jgi:CubicO group peptidase (beta-lactamase class C family)
MVPKLSFFRFLSLLLAVSMVLLGCGLFPINQGGEIRTETHSVDLGTAESVRVQIEMDQGELDIHSSGNGRLMEGTFEYNVTAWKPQVDYSVAGSQGTLVVNQPDTDLAGVVSDGKNEWELSLGESIPLDLEVSLGAGKSDVDLRGIDVTGFTIHTGAGESTVDLSGERLHDLDVTINAGAGDIRVRLPGDVGTRVEIDAGVGKIEAPDLKQDGNVYTNAAYGVSEVTLQVNIRAGIGKIILEVEDGAAATPDYTTVTGELSQLIQAAIEEAGITGLSVALVDDQQIVWSEGFGFADKEKGVEATPQTIYGVASVSKLFTATAILQLADQGLIDIDQPLQTYIPGFSIHSRFSEAGPITPRTLMTHHAGLPSDWTNGMLAFGGDQSELTKNEYHNLVQELELAHVTNPPNTAFSYSNVDYSLLGHAVEQVSGQEFSDYMDEAILGPMGMDSSSFAYKPVLKPRMSQEYRKGAEQEVTWTRDIPAASLRSTVEDLSRFMMMVFAEGELDGQRILRPETVAEMLRPQNRDVPLDFEARWGLGWWMIPLLDYAGVNAWHTGGVGMWSSILYTLPNHKLGVVILSNSEEAEDVTFQIATQILEQALKVKVGLERPAVEPPAVVPLPADEQRRYEGLYTTDLGWMAIRSEGIDLYADVMGQSFKLVSHGEGRFSIEGVSISDAQVSIKEVDGRTAVNFYGFAVGGLGYGERIEPAPISEAWMGRLGSYEVSNGKPGFLTFLTDFQLKYENDFLLLDVTRADTGEGYSFPIGPLSDEEAVILGLGLRGRGETISVVEVDGEEALFYSGYRMRKVEGQVEGPATEGAIYEDPDGRFTLPLVGDWEQIDTDGSYALFEVPGLDFRLYALSVESGDLAAGESAALKQAGFDPSTLTKTDNTRLGDWTINFYTPGEGKGVAPVCQVVDQVTYCLIAAGEESLTHNPPEQVMMTIQGFTIAGKQTALPGTVDEFEAYVTAL